MTDYFDYMAGRKPMGDVVPFEKPKRKIEHVDSSTIVEKLELTPELRKEFEKQGYTFDDDPEPPEAA